MLKEYNFNLQSVKVRSLISTMALFTPSYISLATVVISRKIFSNVKSFEEVIHLNCEVMK